MPHPRTLTIREALGPLDHHVGEDYVVVLTPDQTTDDPLARVYGERAAEYAALFAAAPNLLATSREIDRLSLVIESAVRYADPFYHAAVLAALLAVVPAIALAQGIAARSGETPLGGSTEGKSPVGNADAPNTSVLLDRIETLERALREINENRYATIAIADIARAALTPDSPS